ncbi:PREDICTED: histone-lysine N-methyltransferase, H3 lysine-9 specific SUVH5-like [Ipomoea nil]|uniref:histone-lysine N-methyltransferase, H3 lysine-9 specific SUVH5-like n=1 Tax=Ipomoea nil TaxID=35883 RepID=UPI000901CC3E|nr:PREDICTED: histone-lysine N-methyltransferase, H3 lysine-9 specific SUVH5-like [Ipomoea nil]
MAKTEVLGKNYSGNASKRDEKHYGSSSSRKKTSKIKKWRREYISYVAKMRGTSRNSGENNSGGLNLKAGERERVMELLNKFREICRNLSQENNTQRETKVSEESVMMMRRIDFLAAREVKKMRSLYTQRTNSPGPVPGVEVGDKFLYRMELNLVGLHSNIQKGIDFICNGAGERIATSVVASPAGGYANETSDPNVLIYCGQGGDMVSGIQQEDQRLNNPGNYALKNSIRVKNPVRVIRGTKEKASSSSCREDATTFVYDGLYEVVGLWRDSSCNGKLLYKFKMVRITQ